MPAQAAPSASTVRPAQRERLGCEPSAPPLRWELARQQPRTRHRHQPPPSPSRRCSPAGPPRAPRGRRAARPAPPAAWRPRRRGPAGGPPPPGPARRASRSASGSPGIPPARPRRARRPRTPLAPYSSQQKLFLFLLLFGTNGGGARPAEERACHADGPSDGVIISVTDGAADGGTDRKDR